MPCNSDHMEATGKERELSRVACLLDELDGKPLDPQRGPWRGYHPAVYNKTAKVDADGLVGELCARLQAVDVTKYSLEMQIWWRDHQAVDKARIEHELARKHNESERRAAIAKLTPHERQLLGL